MDTRNARAILEEFYRNPLAAYSTQQLKEELSRRRRDHVALRLKAKLQLVRSYRRIHCRRRR